MIWDVQNYNFTDKKSCFLGYTRFYKWAHNITLKKSLYWFL